MNNLLQVQGDTQLNANPNFEDLWPWYFEQYMNYMVRDVLTRFKWEEVRQLNALITKKINPKYNVGNIGDNMSWKSKKLTYTEMHYVTTMITINQEFTFARSISPVENKTLPELLKEDLLQEIQIKENVKAKAIFKALQQPFVYTPLVQTKFTDKTSFLKYYDNWKDKAFSLGMNITNLLTFVSMDVFNAIRDNIQLENGANDQINRVLSNWSMIKTVEGNLFIAIPRQLPDILPNGTSSLYSFLDSGVQMISVDMSDVEAISLRKVDHTPLRWEKSGAGSGYGGHWFVEEISYFDAKVLEAKKVLISRDNIPTKVNLSTMVLPNNMLVLEELTAQNLIDNIYYTIQANSEWHLVDKDNVTITKDGTVALTDEDVTTAMVDGKSGVISVTIKAEDGSAYWNGQVTPVFNLKHRP